MDYQHEIDEMKREELDIAMRSHLLRRQKFQQEVLAARQEDLERAESTVREAQEALQIEEKRTRQVIDEVRRQRRESERRGSSHMDTNHTGRIVVKDHFVLLQGSSQSSPLETSYLDRAWRRYGSSRSKESIPVCHNEYRTPEKIPKHRSMPDAQREFGFLAQAPTVVFSGIEWIELRCHVCKGNATRSTNQLARGTGGFITHIRRTHTTPKVMRWSSQKVLEFCRFRIVPAEEVRRIREWTDHHPPIEVRKFTAPSAVETYAQENAAELDTASSSEDDQDFRYPVPGRVLASCIERRSDEVYVELRCPQCGRNAKNDGTTQGFYKGLLGFNKHLVQAHNTGLAVEHQDISYWTHRVFSAEEVDAMRAGRADAPIGYPRAYSRSAHPRRPSHRYQRGSYQRPSQSQKVHGDQQNVVLSSTASQEVI